MDASFEWKDSMYKDGLAIDGFLFEISEKPSILSSLESVPANMEYSLVLSEPVYNIERTDCSPPDKVPKLEYYSHYDQEGILCIVDNVISYIKNVVGCYSPWLEYIPLNNSCTATQLKMAMSIITANASLLDDIIENLKKQYTQFKDMNGNMVR
jgi:hypothetical protein